MHLATSRRPLDLAQWISLHTTLHVDTNATVEFVDLTGRIAALVSATSLDCGIVSIQTRHTTTGVVVNELEPLLLEDLRDTIERQAPPSASYRHDDPSRRVVNVVPGERRNGHAHCQALGLRASESFHVVGGRLRLGRWQRVLFVELDGPQRREISVMLMGH